MAAAALPVDKRLQRLLHLWTKGKLPVCGWATAVKITARSDDNDNKGNKESKVDEGNDGYFSKGGATTATATTTTIPVVGNRCRGKLRPGHFCHHGWHLPSVKSYSAVIFK